LRSAEGALIYWVPACAGMTCGTLKNMQGLLLVDKPAGWTSFDVVNYVRKLVAQAEGKKPKNVKVGHTGTLDPFATGLLILLVGKEYTRRASEFSKLDKTYEVTMRLGETSTTGDPEGTITPVNTVISNDSEKSRQNPGDVPRSLASARDDKPRLAEIKAAAQQFIGEIEQIPPAFSAIKINGQRAYKLARAGQEVILEPRKVRINRLQITDYNYPEVTFVADVSSGTYIRTLVEDLAKNLNTGAYTTALRRVNVGQFSVEEGCLTEQLTASGLESRIN